MARRAVSALAATLAIVALALPAELLIGQAGSRGGRQPAGSQSVVSDPDHQHDTAVGAPRHRPITVAGTLRNTSGQQDSHLTVQLLGSAVPVSSVGAGRAGRQLGHYGTARRDLADCRPAGARRHGELVDPAARQRTRR